nr:TetR family transcriptional regulator [Pseudoxanthomonas sp.]
MTPQAATHKGNATREMILARAYDIAARHGLEGLSIGELATAAGMSKSGVFAHF